MMWGEQIETVDGNIMQAECTGACSKLLHSSSSYTQVRQWTTALRIILIAFVCQLSVSSAAAKKLALLIGISEYPKYQVAAASWPAIHGVNDIHLLSATLRKQGFTIHELRNDRATAGNIRQALKAMGSRVGRGDLVYIHFSGHGQPFEDLSGDEADGWDEAIVPYDAQRVYSKQYKGNKHIIDDELAQYINSIRKKVGASGFVYVILDACHIGGASRDETEADAEVYVRGTDIGFSPHGKRYIPKIDRRGHFRVKYSPQMAGICYVEACRAYQTNTEIKENGKFYGSLSFYVNKILSLITLSSNTSWTTAVLKDMGHDRRLIRQNPVIETDR